VRQFVRLTSFNTCKIPYLTLAGSRLSEINRAVAVIRKTHAGINLKMTSSKNRVKSNVLRHAETTGPNDLSASNEQDITRNNGVSRRLEMAESEHLDFKIEALENLLYSGIVYYRNIKFQNFLFWQYALVFCA
jgi:hypothetical protein